jgi:N-6 DNA Methylase
MSLKWAHDFLGWPTQEEVLNPKGTGARLYAHLASEKLGRSIARRLDGEGVRVGILATNPESTEPPNAIVFDFPKKISEETLREAQRLAWNFGYAPLLITIEPHIIRKWSCYEPPEETQSSFIPLTPEIEPKIELNQYTGLPLSEQAAGSLHWVELLTGEFFRQNDSRFNKEKRADQMLLSNLKDVRQRLVDSGLSDDISHDLLARIIFIQFLFDRKDSEGKAALSVDELRRLHEEDKVLSQAFGGIGEILNSYDDTYSLFQWLNSKFNGDLFPSKGTEQEQKAAWIAEMQQVNAGHLNLLARFVSGQECMKDGQLSFWPYYAFDVIPLEFISTIYEEFVKKDVGKGVHYTPPHVVDLILDSVLPWNGQEWDIKVLDPACGSGVFLVKVFQRLVYRWKNAHVGQRINGKVLIQLLEKNLFGVDLDVHAVRVASFSLYLAMCDEIDPRDYWKEMRFPILRGCRLIAADFFSEDQEGIRTIDAHQYDLIVGNPPWGKNTITVLAKEWQSKNNWPVSYGDIGPLFVAKALALTNNKGYLGLLQPASTLLYNQTSAAKEFRNKLFRSVQVEEVINFAALRRLLFRDAIMPACALIASNGMPNSTAFWYTCPKPLHKRENLQRIVIEPKDVHQIYSVEVQDTPWIWCTLLWGSRRDLQLIKRLRTYANLSKLEEQGIVRSREGIIRANPYKNMFELVGRKIISVDEFPQSNSFFLSTESLELNHDPKIYQRDSVDFRAFNLPQLILKKTWHQYQGRFRAAIVTGSVEEKGVLCANNVFLSVHLEENIPGILESICFSFNSAVAVYYLLLSSGRFAMDRNQPQSEAFRSVPIPHALSGLLDNIHTIDQIDENLHEVFGLKEAELLLIRDLEKFTLPDYKGGDDSPGRLATRRGFSSLSEESDALELQNYCETFCKVFRSAYGQDKIIGAIIYSEEQKQSLLPVRIISFYLNYPEVPSVRNEYIGYSSLRQRLTTLYKNMLSNEEAKYTFYQRCVRTYNTVINNSGQVAIRIDFIKPDQVRYWTRSTALRDSDEAVADIMSWDGINHNKHENGVASA